MERLDDRQLLLRAAIGNTQEHIHTGLLGDLIHAANQAPVEWIGDGGDYQTDVVLLRWPFRLWATALGV